MLWIFIQAVKLHSWMGNTSLSTLSFPSEHAFNCSNAVFRSQISLTPLMLVAILTIPRGKLAQLFATGLESLPHLHEALFQGQVYS